MKTRPDTKPRWFGWRMTFGLLWIAFEAALLLVLA